MLLVILEEAGVHVTIGGDMAPEAIHLAVHQLALIDGPVGDSVATDAGDAALEIELAEDACIFGVFAELCLIINLRPRAMAEDIVNSEWTQLAPLEFRRLVCLPRL